MTTAELLLQDYDIEVAMTRRILAARPRRQSRLQVS